MEQTISRKTSRFSRLKVGIAAVAIGALLVIPSAGANDVPVEFEITGGVFWAELTEVSEGMSTVEFSHLEDQTSTGTLNVNVDDATGTTDGWTVSLVADDFVADANSNGADIEASEFTIDHDVATVTGDGESDITRTNGDLGTAFVVAEAASGGGAGTYAWDIGTSLAVEAGQQVGTYTSTVWMTTTPPIGQ